MRLEACHFSVGISQSGVFALRAQSGSGAGPVGTQSGFPSRAQSGFGPSRDSPVGILPSRDFPVGPQSDSQCEHTGSGTFLACPTQCRVGCRVSRGRAPVGFPQSGSVAQSGRACSQSGSSRDRPVGDWPQSGSSRDSPVGFFGPVGPQSGFAQSGIRSVGPQSGFPVGTVLPVGPQSGFVRPQSGPSRTA